jgi:hypothetical protein
MPTIRGEIVMKNFLIACIVAVSFTLGGCASMGGGTGTSPDIANIIAQVQNYTKLACGFVPTVTVVANILSAGNPGVIAAAAVAQAICTAAVPPAAGRKSFSRSVNGWHVTPYAVNGVRVR